MNKNEKKEGKSSNGEKKTRKSTKVNKVRGNENKMPAGEKSEKADDASSKFPNFSVLNDVEKSAFFQALTEARKNVQRRGGPVRERFGTIHDEYLEYFNRQEKKEDEPPLASPALVLDAGDPPETIEEKPRASTPPSEALLKPRGEVAFLERCETVIEEDTNKILGLYQKKKKKNNDATLKKAKEPKTLKPLTKETDEKAKKKEKTEKVPTVKASETSVNMRNTPRFDALNAEEKEVFFKILQEARNNIVEKNPERKKQILPMDSIVKRYRGQVGKKSVFTAKQEPDKFGQEKKTLKVKVTLTSGDNERLLKTIPESPPTANKVKDGNLELSTRRSDVDGLDLVDVSGIEIRDGKNEEHISEHSIWSITSPDLSSWTTTKKSLNEEEEKLRTRSSETFRKGTTNKAKKTPSTGKDENNQTNEYDSTISLTLQDNASERFPTSGKKKPDAIKNDQTIESTKKKLKKKSEAEVNKVESVEIKSVDLGTVDENRAWEEESSEEEVEEGRKEVKRTQSENSLKHSLDKEKEPREAQTGGNLVKKTKRKAQLLSLSEMELQRTKFKQMQLLQAKKNPKEEDELEDREKECEEEQYEEQPSTGTLESVEREDTESNIPVENSEEEVKQNEGNPSLEEECSEEGSKENQKESEKPYAVSTTKVMIVDDNVIDKIRNLIFYLEEKASRDDRLEAEYIKLVVDYVDYLSKVLETLVLKKKAEEVQNAFVAAQVHLTFDDSRPKASKPESRKFVPRSVSEQDFAKQHTYEPQNQEEKKRKEKESRNDDLLLSSDSDSSQESDTEIRYVPPAPGKQVVTTKIRLLQDLINRRAEFVQRSTEDFKIVYHPEKEYVPMPKPKPKTMKIIKEEEDSPIKDNKRKLLKALIQFCGCAKKKVDEDGVFENLKGEAVRVDVTEDKRDAANATLNQSTIEVLKASGRKKIIEKYYSKE